MTSGHQSVDKMNSLQRSNQFPALQKRSNHKPNLQINIMYPLSLFTIQGQIHDFKSLGAPTLYILKLKKIRLLMGDIPFGSPLYFEHVSYECFKFHF